MNNIPVAYRVSIYDSCGVAFATTSAKARWIAVRSYWDAGYGSRKLWPRPTSSRAPELDCKASGLYDLTRLYAEEYLR